MGMYKGKTTPLVRHNSGTVPQTKQTNAVGTVDAPAGWEKHAGKQHTMMAALVVYSIQQKKGRLAAQKGARQPALALYIVLSISQKCSCNGDESGQQTKKFFHCPASAAAWP